MSTLRATAAVVAIVLALAACSTSVTPAPSSVPVATATPSAPTASPSAPAPSVVPSAPSSSVAPSVAPEPSLTLAEVALAGFLRVDARTGCVPRRTDLPPGATLGVECHPADPLVAAVGIYSFPTDGSIAEPARTAYLARLATAGVKTASGDCKTGVPGDHAWPANLPDQGDDGGLSPTRAACFLDENGTANIRLTCYGDLYVGVLGRTKELAALNAWTWKVAAGEDTHRDPPGVCAAPD